MLTDRQHILPRLAAVRGFEHAAVPARRPERALRGYVDDIRIARVDHNARDVLRVLEPQIAPRAAAVIRPVDAVSVAHAALAVVLARPDPHRVRILRIERHRAD